MTITELPVASPLAWEAWRPSSSNRGQGGAQGEASDVTGSVAQIDNVSDEAGVGGGGRSWAGSWVGSERLRSRGTNELVFPTKKLGF